MGGKDTIPEEHREIIDFITELYNRGIRAVTINSPYLCEIIREQFPRMHITIGIYANVDSLVKIKYWMDMGANAVTLVHSLNRNFPLLKEILKYLKGTDFTIRLIGNNGCLHECPYEINHGSSVAHASCRNSNDCYIDYNLVNCYYKKIRNIENLISSEWIRPEDVRFYENLCNEVGNQNLTIKLVERSKTTDYMKNVISAYLNQEYSGNLSEIMNWPEEMLVPVDPTGFLNKIEDGDLNLKISHYYFDFYNVPIPQINNKLLDGFLEHFVNHYNCTEKVCWKSEDKDSESCDQSCRYCYEWAKRAVRFEEEKERQRWLINVQKLKKGLITSEMFRGLKVKGN